MMNRQLKSCQQRRATINRRLTTQVRADAALIVNCKSGGHAFIGYYLAKELLKKGHTVTIMNDGDQVEILSFTAWKAMWLT